MKNHRILFNLVLCFLFINSLNAQTLEFIDFDFTSTSNRFDKITYNSNNFWEIGMPNKIILKGAYSGDSAIITGISNSYPVNCSSSFTVSLDAWESLHFKHKYSTTKGKDGGLIEMSIDNGQTWYPMLDPIGFFGVGAVTVEHRPYMNQGDTLYNGEYGFSGSQINWKSDSITLCYMALKTNFDFLVRFTFISDNVFDNLDGWMIDDLEIRPYGGCPTNVEELAHTNLRFFPNPASGFATLEILNDKVSAATIEIYNELGEIVFEQQATLNNGNNRVPISLSTLSNGLYFVKLNTGSIQSSTTLFVQN